MLAIYSKHLFNSPSFFHLLEMQNIDILYVEIIALYFILLLILHLPVDSLELSRQAITSSAKYCQFFLFSNIYIFVFCWLNTSGYGICFLL